MASSVKTGNPASREMRDAGHGLRNPDPQVMDSSHHGLTGLLAGAVNRVAGVVHNVGEKVSQGLHQVVGDTSRPVSGSMGSQYRQQGEYQDLSDRYKHDAKLEKLESELSDNSRYSGGDVSGRVIGSSAINRFESGTVEGTLYGLTQQQREQMFSGGSSSSQ